MYRVRVCVCKCVCVMQVYPHGLMTSWWVLRTQNLHGAHFSEGPAVNLLDNGRTETLNFNKDLINQDRARVFAAGTVGLDKWIKHTYTYMHTLRQSLEHTNTHGHTYTHSHTHGLRHICEKESLTPFLNLSQPLSHPPGCP